MSGNGTKFTSEQHAAIYTRGVSVGVSAGAGCGKTFVLKERFLTYIEPVRTDGPIDDADPLGCIVAITFTDRAAREMRDRIRSTCAERLKECEEADVPHWLSIFRRIDTARISTIHSFCAGFLRRHAVAAGVDPQFRLMEEENGDTLTRLSIVRTVRRLLVDGDSDCLKLVAHYGLDGTARAVRSLLTGHALVDSSAFLGRPASEFAANWLAERDQVFIPALLGHLGNSPLVAGILDLLRDKEPSNAVMQQRRAALLDRLSSLSTASGANPAAVLAAIREAAQVKGGGGKKAWSSEEILRTSPRQLRGTAGRDRCNLGLLRDRPPRRRTGGRADRSGGSRRAGSGP